MIYGYEYEAKYLRKRKFCMLLDEEAMKVPYAG